MRASSVILVRGRRSETFYVDQDSVNENIDEDMHSPSKDSDDMEGDVDDVATGRCDSDKDEGDKSLEE
jgi:hypothetical protein